MSYHAYRFFLSSDEARGLLRELRDRFELVIGAGRFASPWHPDILFCLIDPMMEPEQAVAERLARPSGHD